MYLYNCATIGNTTSEATSHFARVPRIIKHKIIVCFAIISLLGGLGHIASEFPKHRLDYPNASDTSHDDLTISHISYRPLHLALLQSLRPSAFRYFSLTNYLATHRGSHRLLPGRLTGFILATAFIAWLITPPSCHLQPFLSFLT